MSRSLLTLILGLVICLTFMTTGPSEVLQAASLQGPANSQAAAETVEDLRAADATDLVVKEHHWVDNGYNVRWTADGKYLIFCRARNGFYVMDRRCQDIRHIGKDMYFEGLSPDGKTVYGSHPLKGLFAINISDGKAKLITEIKCGRCNWSPDGKHVVVGIGFRDWGNGFWVCENEKLALMKADGTGLKELPEYVREAQWSPDGTKLIFSDGSYIKIIDVNSVKEIKIEGSTGGWVGNTENIWIYNQKTKEITIMTSNGTDRRVVAKTGWPYNNPFSPTGTWLISNEPETEQETPSIMRIVDSKKVGLFNTWDLIWLQDDKSLICSDNFGHYYLGPPDDPYGGKYLGSDGFPWERIAVAPNQRMFAFFFGESLGIANIDAKNGHALAKLNERGYREIVWSPTCDAIASGSPKSGGKRIDVFLLGRGQVDEYFQDPNPIAGIADLNLAGAIRKQLGKPTGEVSEDELNEIMWLYADDWGIKDLTGLEQCQYLQSLSISGNNISNIDVLCNLTCLKELYLSRNNIQQIEPLKYLTRLQKLDLSDNNIYNIDCLSNLKNLKELNLANNNVEEIEALKHLTKLQQLDLSYNKIDDINALKDLKNLKELRLFFDRGGLDLSPGTEARKIVDELIANGCKVYYFQR
ncbi:MAG: leucine-rich repeat domain-containing protein [Firmicutes bacterium]|nr:leucine-rich repeat domain-containing protein [Bacillota bacterium]